MKKFARYKTGWIFLRPVISSFLWLAFFSNSIVAQTDSVQALMALPELTIAEPRFNRTGYSVWKADSLPTLVVTSLTNRLFWENGLGLRQNAPGTLATISSRGAGPNRTSVVWNGLNLQSPMNGVADASLIPLWQSDRVEVVQGGNSAAQSSGGMGGSVLIESPLQQIKNGFSGDAAFEVGSFGLKTIQGAVGYASSKVSSRVRAQWQTAENDFPFQKKGLNGQVYTTRQQQNFAEKTDVQQFNCWQISRKNVIKTAAWFQNAFRQIPPSITESTSNTWQRDRSGRVVATWEYHPDKKHTLQTRVAWLDEFISFHFAGNIERSLAQTALAGMEWRAKQGHRSEWSLGGNAQYTRARSDGYGTGAAFYGQTRLAGFTQWERRVGKSGKVSAMLRQEWAEAQAAPLTWTVGWEIPIWVGGRIRGHFSRNFNLPTFNDRFWKALGNAELAPEKGYSADLGGIFKHRIFSVELTAFQLILDDWILWQPGTDGIFRPGNLRKVSSRGLEAAGYLYFEIWGIKGKAKGRLQWSETENVAVYGGSEAVLGKQLPYTPQLSAGAGLWASHGGISGTYLHQFTGSRFITTDNVSQLPGFQTGVLMMRYDIDKKFLRWARSFALSVNLDNIWNVAYESLANRPMPGRNWRAGLILGW